MVRKINVDEVTDAYHDSATDPNGSYTGIAVDGGEPTQDADDL